MYHLITMKLASVNTTENCSENISAFFFLSRIQNYTGYNSEMESNGG